MGNATIKKLNFEDVQTAIHSQSHESIIINTLGRNEQCCLIARTINIDTEEEIINSFIQAGKTTMVHIIIYGKNCNDTSIYEKHKQLCRLGFYNVYVYIGGLFEWLLLQDIYGENNFPTTRKTLDIIKYKPVGTFNPHLIEYKE